MSSSTSTSSAPVSGSPPSKLLLGECVPLGEHSSASFSRSRSPQTAIAAAPSGAVMRMESTPSASSVSPRSASFEPRPNASTAASKGKPASAACTVAFGVHATAMNRRSLTDNEPPFAAKNAETQRVVANQILRTHCHDVGARADGAVDVHVERYDYDADAATTTFEITVVSEDGAVDTCAKTLATPNPNKDKPYAPKTPPPKVSVSVNRGEDDEAAKDEL